MVHLKEGEEFGNEESKTVEFKAHDRLSLTQLTQKEIDGRLFQPASRTICAFLNINKKCQLYLGVRDDGTVIGHPMLKVQREHFIQALQKLMKEKFTPAVDDYRYSVEFHEVEAKDPNSVHKNVSQLSITDEHKLLQQPHICWCDKEISQYKRSGKLPPLYIILVRINLWDPRLDSNKFKIWPYYTSEESKCFTRYNASNHEMTQDKIVEETKFDLKELKDLVGRP